MGARPKREKKGETKFWFRVCETVSMSESLASFCTLAQGQEGLALVFLIEKVLSSPKIYTFGEFLSLPNVSALSGDASASQTDREKCLQSYNTLELFAYGTYHDYINNKSNYIELSDIMQNKLKQLSVISMAETSKVIPYADLQEALEISEIRALEDLLIETIYAGLISAKLNQLDSVVRVQSTVGRDVKPQDISVLIEQLTALKDMCSEQISLLQSSTSQLQQHRLLDDVEAKYTQQQTDEIKAELTKDKGKGKNDDPAQILGADVGISYT